MANVKTAISLQQSLFEQVDALAQELQISRSRVFVLAVEAFIQRYQNRQLLAAINEAYDDLPDPEEQSLRDRMRQQHRLMVEGQW
ncbi:MAG: CopG family transcriptional regulator [Anaerolineae bacterium]|nr:MAG: CopG family transcriptional regulator [Anaerolineae bacterium]